MNRRNLEDRSTGGGGGIGSGSGGSSSRAVSSRSRIGKKTPFLDKKNPSLASTRDEKINGCSLQQQQQLQQQKKKISNQEAVNSDVMNNNNINNIVSPPQQQGGCSSSMNDENNNNNNNHTNDNNNNNHTTTTTTTRPAKMVGGEVNEWPRICIPLSRKEKEEDFLAMKGTKLPHRPKKRPKAVERTLQYCFPGLWLSDLPRGRYEVREKKCPRKPKRRGLKGMESMESDSE